MLQHVRYYLVLLLLFITLAAPTTPALAQNTAHIYLKPVATTANSVTVEVMADNVTDLYGLEFKLKFDPTVMAVVDANAQQTGVQIEAGGLLPAAQGFVVVNQADATAGTIAFAMTLLNPAPAVSGSGSLGRITFNVLKQQPATVEIADIKLVSAALQTIPTQITNFTIGQTNAFPWWVVAVAIIGLGLVGLVGFIAVGSRKKFQPAAPKPPRNPQSVIRSGPNVYK